MKKIFAGLLAIVCIFFCAPFARADEAAAVLPTTFSLSEEDAPHAWRLTDNLVGSRISFKTGDTFTVAFDKEAQGVSLSWYELPDSYTLDALDTSGAALSGDSFSGSILNRWHTLPEGCRSIRITVNSKCALSEAAVYGAGPLPETVQRWSPTVEKADLMVLTAQPSAEFRWFSGVIPRYTVAEGIKTAVVYLTSCDKRARTEEALAGLWDAGVTDYPVFCNLYSNDFGSFSVTEESWGFHNTARLIASLIETYRPEVVVTHADTGENAPLNEFVAKCARESVNELTGSWLPKKVYQYDPAGTTAPDFAAPLAVYGGRSAAEAAESALSRHASQLIYGKTVEGTASFRLLYTNVGKDEAHNDLFEHVETASLVSFRAAEAFVPTPAPTQIPVSATPEPTKAPGKRSANNQVHITVEDQPTTKGGLPISVLPLAAGVALSAAAAFILRRRMSRPWAVMLYVAPVVAGIIVFFLLGGAKTANITERRIGLNAPTPTPSATPTPTPTPSPSPTPEPTPTPAPDAEYYRQPNDPAEVVVMDSEHGHWEYRTDELSILIDRVQIEVNEKPVTYYAADIRMRNIYQFRPLFGTEGHTGRGTIYPWRMARRDKAVLWITGDNLINDESEFKGVLIRDGRLFSDNGVEATLVMRPDMTLQIYEKWSVEANELLEDGVENSFSFGPWLIKDGQINPQAKYHRVRRANPRAGIGMIEPGHFIAIVVDGRQRHYSVGITVDVFADLFAEYNCTQAYNLDGGLSAAMIFMGEHLSSHGDVRIGEKNAISYQRAVPDGLAFGYSALVPGEDEPILNDGNLRKD